MPWLQIAFDAARDSAPALEAALEECGALSVTLVDRADDPVFEPAIGEQPLWQSTRVIGLFEADAEREALLQQLTAHLHPDPLPPHTIEQIADQAWERAWIDDFQPMQFGRRLWICPSWHTPEPAAQRVNLLLDPGLAFGTGTHPTTAMCLQALDSLELENLSVIDYGCGSGVLGIAALLLGARHVEAVDNDPQALLATRDNAERNGISAVRLCTRLPPELPGDASADLMVANILAAPLIELAPLLVQHTRPGGMLLLSGILRDQQAAVVSAYRDDCELLDASHTEEWVRLTLRRNAN